MGQRDTAARAFEAVKAMRDDRELNSKFKTLCMKSPALLVQSGLAQTITFLRSRERKKGSPGEKYAAHLVKVLGKDDVKSLDVLQKKALEDDLTSYMELSASVQDAMIWLRRFAQVEMAQIDDAEDEEDR